MSDDRRKTNSRAGRLRRARILAMVVVAAVLLVLLYQTVLSFRTYSNFSVVWEKEELGSSSAQYMEMDGNVLRMTMDGVTYINPEGEILWNYGYDMRSPRAVVQGEYGIIADIQNESAIIFNSAGVSGTISTKKAILNASISQHGVVALVLDDTSANYIRFYDNGGKELDIEIKTILSGDGYPMDIALSPSGTGLVSSVVFLDQSQMQNQITFYNFDVGQNESNRVVGYFNCGDIMYPQVSYLSDTQVLAMGDCQMDLYSVKNESKPELIASVPFEQTIYSVAAGKDLIAVVTQGEGAERLLQAYDFSGNKKYEVEVDFDYTDLTFSGKYLVMYNSAECKILGSRGQVRYEGTLDSSIRGIVMLEDHTCLVMGSSSTRKLRLR